MSKALIEKMLRARESVIPINGHSYTIRRPTDADVVVDMKDAPPMDFIKKFVVDWELTELDFDPGGGSEQRVTFDADLWATYIVDHPELWGPLGEGILGAYRQHIAKQEIATKN